MLDDLTTPLDLDGAALGPARVALTPDRIAFYVEASGDEPSRWHEEAPPGFASVLLFAVADLFLYHPKVEPFTATLLHLDQSFAYREPMRVGSTITMQGTITRVRERAGSYFVTFACEGTDESGTTVLASTSTFVLSDVAAPPPEVERSEPEARYRGSGSGTRAASRHDLVRYAAATRDFNPLHWDHETAVAAGLPGTVVHGLLMYAWLVQAAAPHAVRLVDAKIRFRSALHPGEPVQVTSDRDGDTVRLELTREGTALVTGTATVAGEPSPQPASR